MELERTFYEGVGRVVVAAAGLDFLLATMVRLLDPSEDDLWAVASRPGFAVKALDKIGRRMPPGDEMYDKARAIAADAQKVLHERHRIAHSLHVVTETAAGVREAVTVHPRTEMLKTRQRGADGEAGPELLPTADELAALTHRVLGVGARAAEWLVRYTGMPDPSRT
ncbi:hypothetical protein DQ244_04205 [Blastococcus sp. TBT05-19]|nr:hypothetical protein DQ244_04205 [Blastococcus sp. TBT05-19]